MNCAIRDMGSILSEGLFSIWGPPTLIELLWLTCPPGRWFPEWAPGCLNEGLCVLDLYFFPFPVSLYTYFLAPKWLLCAHVHSKQQQSEMTQMPFNCIKLIRGQLKRRRISSFYCHSFHRLKKRRFAALHIKAVTSIYTKLYQCCKLTEVFRFCSQVLQMLTTLSAVTAVDFLLQNKKKITTQWGELHPAFQLVWAQKSVDHEVKNTVTAPQPQKTSTTKFFFC